MTNMRPCITNATNRHLSLMSEKYCKKNLQFGLLWFLKLSTEILSATLHLGQRQPVAVA